MCEKESLLTKNAIKIMASDFNIVHSEYNPIIQVYGIDNKALSQFGIYYVSQTTVSLKRLYLCKFVSCGCNLNKYCEFNFPLRL